MLVPTAPGLAADCADSAANCVATYVQDREAFQHFMDQKSVARVLTDAQASELRRLGHERNLLEHAAFKEGKDDALRAAIARSEEQLPALEATYREHVAKIDAFEAERRKNSPALYQAQARAEKELKQVETAYKAGQFPAEKYAKLVKAHQKAEDAVEASLERYSQKWIEMTKAKIAAEDALRYQRQNIEKFKRYLTGGKEAYYLHPYDHLGYLRRLSQDHPAVGKIEEANALLKRQKGFLAAAVAIFGITVTAANAGEQNTAVIDTRTFTAKRLAPSVASVGDAEGTSLESAK